MPHAAQVTSSGRIGCFRGAVVEAQGLDAPRLPRPMWGQAKGYWMITILLVVRADYVRVLSSYYALYCCETVVPQQVNFLVRRAVWRHTEVGCTRNRTLGGQQRGNPQSAPEEPG